MALVRQFRWLGAPTTLQIRSDKRRFPPLGLAGGIFWFAALGVAITRREETGS